MSSRSDEEAESTLSAYGDEDSDEVGPFMRKLFEKQLFTDVTFVSNKSTVSAHRAVLASKSPYFENLLFGEQRFLANGMHMQVQIHDVPFSVFRNLVRYCYTGDIEFPADNTVLEIYAAAESFKVQHLLDFCKIYIESLAVTEYNVCSVLQACNAKNVKELKSRCISFIEENTHQVVNSPDFEKCSFTTVREICELERLSLTSELELLGAVLRWTNVQPDHTKKELTKSLIKCIRFLNFSPKEFGDVMQTHGDVLSPDEALNILIYLNNPTPEGLKSLPKWCNKSQRLFRVNYKEIPRDRPAGGRIQIALRSPDDPPPVAELTSELHLKCVKGMHKINSVHFSFDSDKNDGRLLASLVMKVQVLPHGPMFRKNYNVRSRSSLFVFPRGVRVFRDQSVEIEVVAKTYHGCRLLQFERWHNGPERDFQVFLISKPKQGNLFFISEVEYEPFLRDVRKGS